MNGEDHTAVESRFLAATLLVFALLSFLVLQEYLYYVAGAIVLVFSFWPLHKRIRRYVKRPAVAASLSFLVAVFSIVGPILLVGVFIFLDAGSFASTYDPQRLNETLQAVLVQPGEEPARSGEIASWLGERLQGFAERVEENLVQIIPQLVVGLVIMGFVLFYGFLDGDVFYRRVRLAIPLPDEIEDHLFIELGRVTKVVFVGNILTAAVGGVIGGLTFLLFGVPNAMFWGFIMIILGILPFVGAPMVWIPAAAWLYLAGHPVKAFALAAINFFLVVFYIDHILRPRLIGKVAKVHPVLVLVGVLGGVETFGPLGFVIGPLVLAVFIAIVRSYTDWHPRWRRRREAGVEPFHHSDPT